MPDLQPEPVPVSAPVQDAADGPDSDDAGADASDEGGPDEGAWAGMPDEGWADDGRWGDDADVDAGLPAPAAYPQLQPQPQDEVDAPSGSSGSALDAPTVERTAEGDLWQTVVQELLQSDAIVALARQLALQAQLVAREGDQWTLRVESNSLNQAGARERLRAALETAGHARQLQIEQGAVTDSPARRLAVETYLRQGIAEDIVNSNALVQTLKRDFGAKIVPGSIKPISIQPE